MFDNLAEKLPEESVSSSRSFAERVSRKVIGGKEIGLNSIGLDSERGVGKSKIANLEIGSSSRILCRKKNTLVCQFKKEYLCSSRIKSG